MYYHPLDPVPAATTTSSSPSASQSVDDGDIENLFSEIDQFGMDVSTDPIKTYLESSTEAVGDPIAYWASRLSHSPLARMALDFLSAPAASVEIERAFSHGGLTVSKRRHALSDTSVRAATVLSLWAQTEGLIPTDRIIQTFKDKSRRVKKTDIPNVYLEDSDDDEVEIVASTSGSMQ